MPTDRIDPALCPLCGSLNGCSLASGEGENDIQQCWCFHAHIPAMALERIPTAARDMACICATCLRQLRKHPDALILATTPVRLARLQALLKLQK